MRFSRRSSKKTRRSPQPSHRARARSGGTLELLERREMLAADMPSPWQNQLNRYDVNFDQRVSPQDLLTLINDLNRNGVRQLENSALPLAAGSNMRFLDVNGDQRVSPMDALIIINELADEDSMLVRTFATDMAGNPISSIPVGAMYKLVTVVEDVRDQPQFPGVFSAAADISYNPALSSHDPSQLLEFDEFFSFITDQDLSSQGRIIGSGATSETTPPGNAPQFLFSAVLQATAAGTQIYTPQFSLDTFHEYGVYGLDDPLTEDDVQFVGGQLEIIDGVGISISDVTKVEGNADNPFNFTVSLTVAQTSDVTVNYTTNTGTADANDFVAAAGVATIPAGQTTVVIPITVKGDTQVEQDENFTVVISNPNITATITKGTGIGTIQNDDLVSELSIEGDTVTNVTAGTTTANFTVTVAAPVVGAPVTVVYQTANDTAFAGVDYEATSGTLTFNPGGSQSQVVPVTILGDPNPDDVDRFFVNLSNPSANAMLVDGQAVIQINPAVESVTLEVERVNIFEGDSGTTPMVFTINLSNPSAAPVVVSYSTTAVTADGTDFAEVTTPQTITFDPGVTSREVTISVFGDVTVEPNEVFLLNVNAISGASGDLQVEGRILDDDGPPIASIGDAVVAAGSDITFAVFEVTVSGDISQAVSVSYASGDNTAFAGVDYEAVSGILTFVPGGPAVQEILVPIRRSSAAQPDKSFFVTLSSPSSGLSIDDDLGVGTIVTQGISISNATLVEGNTGATSNMVFTVTLSRVFDDEVRVSFQTGGGNATPGVDYTPTSGTLIFTPGNQTLLITVPVLGDDVQEGNETFNVNLSGAVGAPIFSGTGIGTILDNDGFKVNYRITLTELDGTTSLPGTIDVDQEFLLQVHVFDVQTDPTGLAQAFLDVLYQSSLVTPTDSPTFGPFLNRFPTGRFEDGLLDDFGAFGQDQPPVPPNPTDGLLLFSIPFRAIDVGLLTFTGVVTDEALDPGHETLVYLSDDEVPFDEITVENPPAVNIGSNVITISDAQVTEGGPMVFTVTRFLPTTETAVVVWRTIAGGSATAGSDYTPTSGTLTFVPGEPNTQLITVATLQDSIDEANETFSVELTSVTGASISGLPLGTGTIIDDDGEPTVNVGNAQGSEGGNATFTVNLSNTSGKRVTVVYSTALTGTATSGVDYTPVSGTLTFEPTETSKTVVVPLLGDILLESNESFQLVLSSPTNATLGNATGNGTIVDVPPAGISGYVYVDGNKNGIKDASEVGISGATVTVSRADGFSQSTTTAADGSYLFVGLLPGTYTITETQPGFYKDGRDTRFGIDSTFNDRFVNVSLAPSAAESGYNFGEEGLRSDFLALFFNRRALFASAANGSVFSPELDVPGAMLDLRSGDVWVSFDGGWDGLRQIDALFDPNLGTVTMKLYNNALQEIAVSSATATGATMLHSGQAGETYFLRITGSSANVRVSMSSPTLPANLAAPTGSSGSEGGESTTPPVVETPPPPTSTSRWGIRPAAAEAPESEPLAGVDSSEDVFADDDDWVLDSLLS